MAAGSRMSHLPPMSSLRLAVLADRQVHVIAEDGSSDSVTSPYVEGVHRREASIERKTAWKTQGTGARFMGAAALWDDQGTRSPAAFTALSKGRKRGEILYAISTGTVSGLFALDLGTREEQRLVHDTNGDIASIASSDDHCVLAFTRDNRKTGSRNIAVMRDDGGDHQLVTDGDTIDDAPSWVPVARDATEGRHQLVFQSTGIGRDATGAMAGFAPTEINLLDAESGAMKTILSSPEHDYLTPRMTLDGTLYVMRRPYRGLPEGPDVAAHVKDGLLMPFRLAYAGFRYLDFFSQRYAGKPLANAGNVKARNMDARKLLERQNIAAAGDVDDAMTQVNRAPSEWELVRRLPSGAEEVLAKNVAAFDVDAAGHLFTSDGAGIERVSDGKRIAKVPRALTLVAI